MHFLASFFLLVLLVCFSPSSYQSTYIKKQHIPLSRGTCCSLFLCSFLAFILPQCVFYRLHGDFVRRPFSPYIFQTHLQFFSMPFNIFVHCSSPERESLGKSIWVTSPLMMIFVPSPNLVRTIISVSNVVFCPSSRIT